MIPGSNLLNQALTVIVSQTGIYYKERNRVLNNVGQDISEYDPPFLIYGSLQPVSRTLYKQLGLDLQKTYYTFYTPNDVIDLGRDVSGDQIVFNQKLYQCESSNDWYVIDGWVGILCVLIKDALAPNLMITGFNEIPLINQYTNFLNGNFPGDT